MNQEAASRIQSSEARSNSGQVSSGGFASRAQAAAAHNQGSGSSSGGQSGQQPQMAHQ